MAEHEPENRRLRHGKREVGNPHSGDAGDGARAAFRHGLCVRGRELREAARTPCYVELITLYKGGAAKVALNGSFFGGVELLLGAPFLRRTLKV